MRAENISGSIMQNVSGTTGSARTKAEETVNSASSEIESSVKRDKFTPSPKEESAGLYKIERDENGSRKISFNSPENNSADNSENTNVSEKSNSVEKLTCNTDKVTKEIKHLKEKAARLKQQLLSADGTKAEKIRRQLQNVRREIAGKDRNTSLKISA